MIFRRREPRPPDRAAYPAGDGGDRAEAQTSASMTEVLRRLSRLDRPEVLDLGPLCGQTATFLAGSGARVHVDRFEPPRPTPARKPGEDPVEPDPLAIEQPGDSFDLVLAWENADFVPPDRLAEFGGEIRRILRHGGLVLLFALGRKVEEPDIAPRYRVFPDGRIAREAAEGPGLPRWSHPNREIELALDGLAIKGVHLQRNQMREILAEKG